MSSTIACSRERCCSSKRLSVARVPRLSLVVRKAFGLAFFSMGGSNMGSDLLVAWPGAEIGFMDPVVGANVLYADRLSGLAGDDRREELYRLAAQLGADSDPRAIAAAMNLDDVIEPADTRRRARRCAGALRTRRHTRAERAVVVAALVVVTRSTGNAQGES